MRKEPLKAIDDELRPEYDLSQLKGGARGKYYQQAKAGTNLILIEPDLAGAFPDGESVNRALRFLLAAADAATRGSRRHRAAPTSRRKRSSRKSIRLAAGR